MNWRTDKPTADVIVAKLKESFCRHPASYRVLYKGHFGLYYYGDGCEDIPPSAVEKWADLEEDETVTGCNELEEAAEEWCKENHKGIALAGDKKSHYLADGLDAFIAGAKWGAEHLKKGI